MGKLTIKKIENAAPREKEYKIHDGEGLFLRIRPSGAKSWLFSFSLPKDKKVIRMTLGVTDKLSLKEARSMLPGLHKLVSDGIDPRNARAATQAENGQAITMQKLFDAWIEMEKIAKNVTATWIKRHEDRWRLHLKNHLGNLLARDVNRAHLAAALDAMMRKGIREETRKALTTLNLMLDYGLTRNFIEQNPARILKPKDFKSTANKPRDRVLSLEELQKLWSALNQMTGHKNVTSSIMTVSAIKLLILTGARRGEVAGMRWDELDLNAGIWNLPADRTKNGHAHTVYLSSLAIEIIQALLPISSASSFVLDTGFSDDSHVHPDTLTTALSRLQGLKKGGNAPLIGIKPFSIHDLRRSVATGWIEYLKVDPHIIERMLNHQPKNRLVATYQRAVYTDEQKAAWIEWGAMMKRFS